MIHFEKIVGRHCEARRRDKINKGINICRFPITKRNRFGDTFTPGIYSVIYCSRFKNLKFGTIKYFDDIPVSVSINEAVELAKKFSYPEAPAFINGILGSVSRE